MTRLTQSPNVMTTDGKCIELLTVTAGPRIPQSPDRSKLTAACLLCVTARYVNNEMISAPAHFDDKLISEIFAVAG